MKKNGRYGILAAMLLLVLVLSGCCLSHEWEEATCAQPKTCAKCGETEGEALPHVWREATCTAPKTCKDCGAAEGETEPHKWKDATCTAPKTCRDCGETEGVTLDHTWKEADCEAPETCGVCGETRGEALGHVEAAAEQKKTDCVNAVVSWNTCCERCQKVLSTRKEEMTVLHENKMFLMTPQEFTKRLNAAFRYVPMDLEAQLMPGDNYLSVVLSSGSKYLGHMSMSDMVYDSYTYVQPGMEDNALCFNTMLALFSKDADTAMSLVAAIVIACDPTLNPEENFDAFNKVASAVLDGPSYQYNGITYIFGRPSDMDSSIFMIRLV